MAEPILTLLKGKKGEDARARAPKDGENVNWRSDPDSVTKKRCPSLSIAGSEDASEPVGATQAAGPSAASELGLKPITTEHDDVEAPITSCDTFEFHTSLAPCHVELKGTGLRSMSMVATFTRKSAVVRAAMTNSDDPLCGV